MCGQKKCFKAMMKWKKWALFFCIDMYVQMKWIIENAGWEVSPSVDELDLGTSKCMLTVDCKKGVELRRENLKCIHDE